MCLRRKQMWKSSQIVLVTMWADLQVAAARILLSSWTEHQVRHQYANKGCFAGWAVGSAAFWILCGILLLCLQTETVKVVKPLGLCQGKYLQGRSWVRPERWEEWEGVQVTRENKVVLSGIFLCLLIFVSVLVAVFTELFWGCFVNHCLQLFEWWFSRPLQYLISSSRYLAYGLNCSFLNLNPNGLQPPLDKGVFLESVAAWTDWCSTFTVDLLVFCYQWTGQAQQMLCMEKGFFGTPLDEMLTLPRH